MKLRYRRILPATCKAGTFYAMVATPHADGSIGINVQPAVLEWFNPMSEEWEAVEFVTDGA